MSRLLTSVGVLAAVFVLTVPLPASAQSAAPKAAAPKPPAPPKPAAQPAGPVDKVIDMVKAGFNDDLVIRAIGKEGLKADLSSADMVRLKKAGVSDKVIDAMDPASGGGAPAAAAAPAPASAAPAPAVAAAPPPAAADPRAGLRTAAVDEFDWAAVRSYVQEIFHSNVDIGKGIRAMLIKRVADGGKMRVVERAKVNTLMKEQDFDQSNRVKKGTGSRIGQIRGADVYIMGDIVVFGRDDKKKGVSGIAVPGVPAIGALRLGKKEEKAVIVINYRILDAETSEVIGAGEARGESKRESKGVGGFFAVPGAAGGATVDMGSSNFAATIIGEATIAAVDKIAEDMNAKIPGLPKREIDIEARVADASKDSLTIAAGTNEGVQVGDRFEVFRIVSQIKDPVTGDVLDNKTVRLGDLVIVEVRERIATGRYTGAAVTTKDGLVRKRQ